MPDVFTKEKRSAVMSRIRGRGNKNTELLFAKLLRKHRIFGWRRHVNLAGRPDFIFRRQKIAIFIDGCFWHGCPKHANMPVNNREFWFRKLSGNKRRDMLVNRTLKQRGWSVIRIWEHDLARSPNRSLGRIRRLIQNAGRVQRRAHD
jgi:DNA mismatch endonuclease (patch repair protein)